jgi:hypothetical protein
MLLAVVVMLIGYEGTILIKLWYWTAEFNVRVLKELGRLQLLTAEPALAAEVDAMSSAPSPAAPVGGWWDRISRQRLGSVASILLVIAAVAGMLYFVLPVFHGTVEPARIYEEHIELADDGSCLGRSRSRYTYDGFTPLETVDIQSTNPLIDPVWRDAEGNVLEHDVRQEPDGYHYTVHFPQPIYRGESVDLRTECRFENAAGQEDGRWVYDIRRTWFGVRRLRPALTISDAWQGRSQVNKTIMLPPGAEFLSAEPAAKMRWKDKDRWVMYFEDEIPSGTTEEQRVCYRIPSSTGSDDSK